MTDIYQFSDTQILLFCLVLVRMSAFVVSWPVFGTEMVSNQVKVLFALLLTMTVFPNLTWNSVQIEATTSNLILLVLKEAFVGLSIGYLARLFFFTFRVAGEMASQAMGLSAAQMFNPAVGGQSTALEQFYVGLATLFYLTANGHHHLITGLVDSFTLVPAAYLTLNVSHFPGMAVLTHEVIEMGLKLSAPVVIAILAINIILGVVGKTVPQLNVLVTSFPINILLGFAIMLITLPMLMDNMDGFLEFSTTRVFQFVKAF